MKILKSFVAVTLALAVGVSAFADEAYDIVKKSTTLEAPDTSTATMMLHNIEKNGAVEDMPMKQYGRKVNGLINTVFDIKGPAGKKDTRVLQMEQNGRREDDRWIYMPKLKQVRRIPMGERYKQFVGCEFTYNDMAIRHVDDDKHELLESNVKVTAGSKNYTCWKIKSVPYKKSEVEYSYRIQYIDKETYLPAKIEYFDKKDLTQLMKTYTTEDWIYLTSKTGKKYTMRMKARVANNKTGRETLLEIQNPIMDGPMSPSYFTQQFLSTGKAK